MTIDPKCHVCNNGQSLKLRGAYRCCGCAKYICKRHHNSKPWKGHPEDSTYRMSYCTVCNPIVKEAVSGGQ